MKKSCKEEQKYPWNLVPGTSKFWLRRGRKEALEFGTVTSNAGVVLI